MSYSQFNRKILEEKMGLDFLIRSVIPRDIPFIEPDEYLCRHLDEIITIPMNNEKAFSELLIVPIMVEVWKKSGKKFALHSGEALDADPELGLNGPCDFILTADPESKYISAPVIAITEAKYEQFEAGIFQCAAQLYGAKIFNQKKGLQTDELWGCSANGKEWYFFKLKDNEVIQHPISYSYRNLPELLGVWDFVIKAALGGIRKIENQSLNI